MATYKIRKFTNGRSSAGAEFTNYSLTVPANVAKELPDDVKFSCELTEDGILFRPVKPEEIETTLPSWAARDGAAKPAAKAKPAPKAKAPAKTARKAPAKKAEKAEEPVAEKPKAAPARKAPARKPPAARKAPAKAPAKTGARPRPGAKKPVAA